MSKLLNLKEWVTIEDAARHLSIMFGEQVAEPDILRLALDGHLTLSVNFVNGAYARAGCIKEASEARHIDVPVGLSAAEKAKSPGEYQGGWEKLCMGIALDDSTKVIDLEDEVVELHGVYDLPMIGGEQLDIERRFQRMTDGPAVTSVTLDGAFIVAGNADEVLQLQEHFEDNGYVDPARLKKPWHNRENFYPADRLPSDSVLVVRTDSLMVLRELAVEAARDKKPKATLSTRERETLLKLVIGMAIEGYRYSPDAARSEAPAEIAGDLAKQGISVTDDTVRKWLKEASNTVLPRRPPDT